MQVMMPAGLIVQPDDGAQAAQTSRRDKWTKTQGNETTYWRCCRIATADRDHNCRSDSNTSNDYALSVYMTYTIDCCKYTERHNHWYLENTFNAEESRQHFCSYFSLVHWSLWEHSVRSFRWQSPWWWSCCSNQIYQWEREKIRWRSKHASTGWCRYSVCCWWYWETVFRYRWTSDCWMCCFREERRSSRFSRLQKKVWDTSSFNSLILTIGTLNSEPSIRTETWICSSHSIVSTCSIIETRSRCAPINYRRQSSRSLTEKSSSLRTTSTIDDPSCEDQRCNYTKEIRILWWYTSCNWPRRKQTENNRRHWLKGNESVLNERDVCWSGQTWNRNQVRLIVTNQIRDPPSNSYSLDWLDRDPVEEWNSFFHWPPLSPLPTDWNWRSCHFSDECRISMKIYLITILVANTAPRVMLMIVWLITEVKKKMPGEVRLK